MNTFPDFSKVERTSGGQPASYDQWKAQLEATTGKRAEDYVWDTMEKIPGQAPLQ
jgi:hypothetical protein